MFETRPARPVSPSNPDVVPAGDVVPASPGRRRYRGRRNASDDGGSAQVAGPIASLVRIVANVIVAIIVVGILLVVLKANPSNTIVSAIHDLASSLVGPFDGMFSLDSARLAVAVNWGIAAVVYLIVAGLIVRLIAAFARR